MVAALRVKGNGNSLSQARVGSPEFGLVDKSLCVLARSSCEDLTQQRGQASYLARKSKDRSFTSYISFATLA
jgi:hypothetical protein